MIDKPRDFNPLPSAITAMGLAACSGDLDKPEIVTAISEEPGRFEEHFDAAFPPISVHGAIVETLNEVNVPEPEAYGPIDPLEEEPTDGEGTTFSPGERIENWGLMDRETPTVVAHTNADGTISFSYTLGAGLGAGEVFPSVEGLNEIRFEAVTEDGRIDCVQNVGDRIPGPHEVECEVGDTAGDVWIVETVPYVDGEYGFTGLIQRLDFEEASFAHNVTFGGGMLTYYTPGSYEERIGNRHPEAARFDPYYEGRILAAYELGLQQIEPVTMVPGTVFVAEGDFVYLSEIDHHYEGFHRILGNDLTAEAEGMYDQASSFDFSTFWPAYEVDFEELSGGITHTGHSIAPIGCYDSGVCTVDRHGEVMIARAGFTCEDHGDDMYAGNLCATPGIAAHTLETQIAIDDLFANAFFGGNINLNQVGLRHQITGMNTNAGSITHAPANGPAVRLERLEEVGDGVALLRFGNTGDTHAKIMLTLGQGWCLDFTRPNGICADQDTPQD